MEEKRFDELEIGAQFRPISLDTFEKISASAAKIVSPGPKAGFIHGFSKGKQVVTGVATETTKDETKTNE